MVVLDEIENIILTHGRACLMRNRLMVCVNLLSNRRGHSIWGANDKAAINMIDESNLGWALKYIL